MCCDKYAIVIDNGSSTIKAGFSGEETPGVVFPTVVGKPRDEHRKGLKDFFVGNETQTIKSILTLKNPIVEGIIENWDDMEKIWNHIFQDRLEIDPKEHRVLLTEAPMNEKENRERMCKIMFETFNIPAVFVENQAVLSLFASKLTTGIILESGYGNSHIVPIYEGKILSMDKIHINGRKLTEYMTKLLIAKNISSSITSEKKIINDIKESLCYVALDYNSELINNSQAISHQLPDGQIITINDESFNCPETLFNPTLLGFAIPGIHVSIINSIKKCKDDIHKDLFGNVVLSGGNTMFRGIEERLLKEINNLVPEREITIVAPLERKYSVWIGGSILTSLPNFQENWITKQEYDENGPNIVHKGLKLNQ